MSKKLSSVWIVFVVIAITLVACSEENSYFTTVVNHRDTFEAASVAPAKDFPSVCSHREAVYHYGGQKLSEKVTTYICQIDHCGMSKDSPETWYYHEMTEWGWAVPAGHHFDEEMRNHVWPKLLSRNCVKADYIEKRSLARFGGKGYVKLRETRLQPKKLAEVCSLHRYVDSYALHKLVLLSHERPRNVVGLKWCWDLVLAYDSKFSASQILDLIERRISPRRVNRTL